MVISGVFELTINGEKKILSAGDGYFVEPDVEHSAVCIEAGTLVDAFNPSRTDFLGNQP
jgi:quercetin dioxygenase-like cupin family protein